MHAASRHWTSSLTSLPKGGDAKYGMHMVCSIQFSGTGIEASHSLPGIRGGKNDLISGTKISLEKI